MEKSTKKILLAAVLGVGAYMAFGSKAAPNLDPVLTTAPDPNAEIGYPIVYNKYHPDAKLLQAACGITGKQQDGIIGPNTLGIWKTYNSAVTQYFKFDNRGQLDKEIIAIKAKKGARAYQVGRVNTLG